MLLRGGESWDLYQEHTRPHDDATENETWQERRKCVFTAWGLDTASVSLIPCSTVLLEFVGQGKAFPVTGRGGS
jgi:hypothetical protein